MPGTALSVAMQALGLVPRQPRLIIEAVRSAPMLRKPVKERPTGFLSGWKTTEIGKRTRRLFHGKDFWAMAFLAKAERFQACSG